MRKMIGVLVLVSLMLASCSTREAESYASADALAAFLTEEGVPCSDAEALPQAELIADGLRCQSDGTNLSVYLFSSPTDRDNWRSFGSLTNENLVVGPNWIVSTPNEARAEQIRKVTGGE